MLNIRLKLKYEKSEVVQLIFLLCSISVFC
uniref:Uncharacterized protein n=1 Tax=Arundo donax TaxID=35708 RepID=A0A0A9DN40_ARUDO